MVVIRDSSSHSRPKKKKWSCGRCYAFCCSVFKIWICAQVTDTCMRAAVGLMEVTALRSASLYTYLYGFCFQHCSSEHKLSGILLLVALTDCYTFELGAGPCTATHAAPTARNFFLANFYPSGPFTCFFTPKNLPRVFLVLAVANTGSCVGPQNKLGHPAHRYRDNWCRFPCLVPAE